MSAPSFPSFSSFPEIEPTPSSSASKQEPAKSSKAKRLRNEHEGDRKHKHSSHSRSEGDGQRKRKHRKSKPHDDELGDVIDARLPKVRDGPLEEHSRKPLYYSDRRGDPLNIRYGGIHAGDIPKYHLVARGRKVLGLSPAWTASYRSHNGVEIGLSQSGKAVSLTDSKSRALLALPPRRFTATPSSTRRYEEIDGFIRLPSRKDHTNPDSSYRDVLRNKDNPDHTSSESSDSDDDVSSEADEDAAPTLSTLHLTIKSLEQQLTSDPTSISTWLSLLSHTLSTIPIASKNATQARSEITVTLLQRALAAHPNNSGSSLLRIKYLKAGEEVWHESKVRAEWETALKLNKPSLWMEWLEWRIRKDSRGIVGILEDAQRAMRAFGTDDQGECAKIRVFWRAAVMLRSAGYAERAMALFQAQAELTFEVPQDLFGLPLAPRLDSLEEFWESEMPRVGELGSKGWSAYRSSDVPQPAPGDGIVSAESHPNIPDPYARWAKLEQNSDKSTLLPARSFDPIAASDPYATILFSDIRDLLLDITSDTAKHAFRLIWLSFLGLHIPGLFSSLSLSCEDDSESESWDDRWCLTHLTTPANLDSIFPSQSAQKLPLAEASSGVLIGTARTYLPVFGPVKSWGAGVLGPLDPALAFPMHLWSRADLDGVDVGLIRRVFEQLRLNSSDFEWDMLALAYESSIGTKSAIKLSRSFLSKNQTSFAYWAAHAKLERLRGKLDEARKVYHTILIASSPPSASKVEQGPLWRDWAEMEWCDGRDEGALQVILKSVSLEGKGDLVLLRAKRQLQDLSRPPLNDGTWRESGAWVHLLALLEVLGGGGISAALRTYDEHMESHKPGSAIHESLVVASLTLLYRYGTVLKRPVAPGLLRDRASKGLEQYGSNSIVLAMFLESEKGQGVWGRVRSILGDEAVGDGQVKGKSIARRVEEVWIAGWEQGRWLGEVERTRKGLSGAVESERTRASHIVWRVYIEFEIRVDRLDRAKKLLYRAISECPYVKDLYLLAFGPLRKAFTGYELKAFVDTMAERGIRLRHEMEDGGDDLPRVDGDDGSESGMDEIEQRAEEYRRLRPY